MIGGDCEGSQIVKVSTSVISQPSPDPLFSAFMDNCTGLEVSEERDSIRLDLQL